MQLTSKHIYGVFNSRRIYRQLMGNGQVENICTSSPFPLSGIYPQVTNICQMYRFWKVTLIENCTSHEDPCTFVIVSRWILLRMRNVSDKICRENQNTHLAVFPENGVVLRDNVEKYYRSRQAQYDTKIRGMSFACGYKHALRICNNFLLCHCNDGSPTRLSVTFYVDCLSCFSFLRLGVSLSLVNFRRLESATLCSSSWTAPFSRNLFLTLHGWYFSAILTKPARI